MANRSQIDVMIKLARQFVPQIIVQQNGANFNLRNGIRSLELGPSFDITSHDDQAKFVSFLGYNPRISNTWPAALTAGIGRLSLEEKSSAKSFSPSKKSDVGPHNQAVLRKVSTRLEREHDPKQSTHALYISVAEAISICYSKMDSLERDAFRYRHLGITSQGPEDRRRNHDLAAAGEAKLLEAARTVNPEVTRVQVIAAVGARIAIHRQHKTLLKIRMAEAMAQAASANLSVLEPEKNKSKIVGPSRPELVFTRKLSDKHFSKVGSSRTEQKL